MINFINEKIEVFLAMCTHLHQNGSDFAKSLIVTCHAFQIVTEKPDNELELCRWRFSFSDFASLYVIRRIRFHTF